MKHLNLIRNWVHTNNDFYKGNVPCGFILFFAVVKYSISSENTFMAMDRPIGRKVCMCVWEGGGVRMITRLIDLKEKACFIFLIIYASRQSFPPYHRGSKCLRESPS